jgi:hypothetical protein
MPKNGFRLFQVFGITVYLHWSWLLVAAYEIQSRQGKYQSFGWNIAEYVSLFAIVLMHEFGHALACRSVGGKADRIVLWPLGGVAYVSPPMRPGAMLWSIVAGPLVNVALLPVTLPFLWLPANSDLNVFLQSVAGINLILLIFNILPIYPLDGGQRDRNHRRSRSGSLCVNVGRHLAGNPGAFRRLPGMGRIQKCPRAAPPGNHWPPTRILLPRLQDRASDGAILGLPQVQIPIRCF